jgi:hypothetical protein
MVAADTSGLLWPGAGQRSGRPAPPANVEQSSNSTPARKPRTECDCQPVAFIIAAIVAPAGDCSMAITRDCFKPASASCVCCGGFAVATVDGAVEGDFFFADFDIEILRSVMAASRRTTEAPPSALAPAGQDLASAPWRPE